MILSLIIVSFTLGVVVTLVVQYFYMKWHFLQLPVIGMTSRPQFDRFQLPQSLGSAFVNNSRKREGSEASKDKDDDVDSKSKAGFLEEDTCLSLNLIFQFLFRELKDTSRARRWMFKKMNIEFDEMLKTTTGKLLDRIQVREVNFGSEFPIVHSVHVQKMDLKDGSIETLDLDIDLDYSGGFQLAVDVDLVLGTWAYLSVKVTKLKGRARLQLTRDPFTHWSFAFHGEPKMEFEVDSRFNGRPIPQITSLIVNQIKRTLRKKHILPNYKMRFKPFFLKSEPLPDHVAIRGRSLGVGSLDVTVVECSRLHSVIPDAFIYCTVSVDSLNQADLWKRSCSHRTVHISAPSGGAVGINLTDKNQVLWEHSERPMVVVDSITQYSPASQADIQQGDIVEFIGSVRVMSARQAAKQIKNAGERFTMRIRRPHIRSHYQDSSQPDDIYTAQEAERDLCSEIETKEEAEGYINISVKSDEKSAAMLDDSKNRSTPDRTKFMERAIPQKGLSLLSAGKKKLLGRKDLESSTESTGKSQLLSPARSPSTSPVLRRKSIPTETDINSTKASRSQSVTAPQKKCFENDSEALDRSQSAKSSPQKRISEIKRPRAQSDTCLSKLSEGDTSSLGGEVDSGADTPEESYFVNYQTTKQVPFSVNPRWEETFQFACENDDQFVNVCLWCHMPQRSEKSEKQARKDSDRSDRHLKKDQDKNEKSSRNDVKTLVGYVSLPLSDIALHSMMTLQGDSLHTVYLNSPEPRAVSSRTKLLKMVQLGYDTSICHGDITLKFNHHPVRPVDPALRKELLKGVFEPESIPPHRQIFQRDMEHLKQTGSVEDSNKHSFIATQFPSGTHCHYCGKKIWFKGAFQCSVCFSACHKKCVQKCQHDTVCTKEGIKDRLRPEEKWVPLSQHNEVEKQTEKDELAKSPGIFSKFRKETGQLHLNVGHSRVSPQVSPQPSPTPSPIPSPQAGRKSFGGSLANGSASDGAAGGLHLSVSGLFNSSSNSSLSQLFSQLASPAVTPTDTAKDDYSDDSEDEAIADKEVRNLIRMARKSSDKGHSLDDTIVIEAKEKGRELYSHLSLPERKQTLDDMVTKLQQALDKESEHKAELMRAQLDTTDESQKRHIKFQLDKSEEKMEALMMMMVHYCAGLQHCMDIEEDDERKHVTTETSKADDGLEDCGIEFVVTKESPIATEDRAVQQWES